MKCAIAAIDHRVCRVGDSQRAIGRPDEGADDGIGRSRAGMVPRAQGGAHGRRSGLARVIGRRVVPQLGHSGAPSWRSIKAESGTTAWPLDPITDDVFDGIGRGLTAVR